MAIAIEKLRQADLNLLVYFVVLVEEKSVSRAATRLHLTQSALSRALMRLREMFNDELIVRRDLGYQTTRRGEDLLGQLALMLPQLTSLLSGGGFDPSKDETAFNVTVPDGPARFYSEALAQKSNEMSQVTISFWHYHPDRYETLESNARDLIIDADYLLYSEMLRSEVLSEERLVCVVAKESTHPKKQFSLDEYLASSHIALNLLNGGQPIPGDPFAGIDARRKCAFAIPYLGIALPMIPKTDLVATVASSFANALIDRKTMRIVEAPPQFRPFRFVMVWHRRNDNDPRHIWLRQTFREAAKEVRKRLSNPFPGEAESA